MRKPVQFLIVSAALGIAAAFLRVTELETAFDPLTGLAEKNAPASFALMALSFAAAALFLFFAAVLWQPFYSEMKRAGSQSTAEKAFSAMAAILILASGGAEIVFSLERPLSRSILALFTILAGISIFSLLFASKNEGRAHESATFALVPVFFSCYRLVIAYAERSSDPVLAHYVYELLTLIAVLLYLYYRAGFAFKNSRPRNAVFFGLLTVYLTVMVILTQVLVLLRPGLISAVAISDMLCHLGMGLFVAGTLSSAARPRIAVIGK